MASNQPNTHVPRTTITIRQHGAHFSLRAVAIALHDGHILLNRCEKDDYWFLPGGRCELLESAPDAIRREMREELGTEVRIERLLWVVENFFEEHGVACHEVGFYFLIDLGPDFSHYALGKPFAGDEDGFELSFCWFAIDTLRTMRVYPTFVHDVLDNLPDHVEHIVHHESKWIDHVTGL
jgi:ADP-ribose pyrophosphatase YjhB (NUDIX family)